MSIPKRHHYVPRFVLANFVDHAGKLWVQRVSGGEVWSAVPENVYVQRYAYSLVDAEGNRDPEVERAYSVLEGAPKPIVDKFLAAGRTGSPPVITVAEKAVWDEFLYHQMKRVPAVMATLEAKQGWADRLEAVVERLRERGLAVDEEELADLRSPASLALKRNAQVKALSTDSPLIRVLLGAASIEIGAAPAGNSLVISSHPIAGIRAGIQSAETGASEMWLPIASDVAVKVSFGGQPQTVELTPDKVASINRDSRAQGEFLAGASEKIVKSVP